MKNILPLVVSLVCFCVVRNFFIIFIDKKRVNNILINALSLTITGLAYFAFIKIVGLASNSLVSKTLERCPPLRLETS